MRFLAFCLLFVTSATSLLAQEIQSPKPGVIHGADKTIPVGGIVDLSVSDADKPANAVSFSTDWVIFELPSGLERHFKFVREIDPAGAPVTEGVVFGTGKDSTELIVVCSKTYLLVTKEMDKITLTGTKTELLRARVIIGEGSPDPEPAPPKPKPPGPAPVFPDGKFGLAKTMYDICMTNEKSRVKPGESREAGAKALVKALRGVKASIAAKVLTDPVDILKKSGEANSSAIKSAGVSREEWLPAFTALQEVLFDLYEQDKLKTASDFETALGEIADGVEKVTR